LFVWLISITDNWFIFRMGKYELRPAVKKLYQLRPELSTPNMTSCFPRLVRNCISFIER